MRKNQQKKSAKISGRPKRPMIAMLLVALAFGSIGTYFLVASHADTTLAQLSETFGGNQVTNHWITNGAAIESVSPGAPQVCLTAGNGSGDGSNGTIPGCAANRDSSGNGALRLTNNNGAQSGIVVNANPIQLDSGYHITFDMYQYGYPFAAGGCTYHGYAGGCVGGDGISFFLIDGSQVPTSATVGVAQGGGGLLGYINQNGGPGGSGLHGGYVGVGFDEFGNYSYPPAPNSIAVRGSETSGYAYVTGRYASQSLATDSAISKSDSDVRHVQIYISSTRHMAVQVSYGSGVTYTEIPDIDLSTVNKNQPIPSSMYIGFGSGTGGTSAFHEIKNLVVAKLSPGVGGALVGVTGTGAGSAAGTGAGVGPGTGSSVGKGTGSAGTGSGTTAGTGDAAGTTKTTTSTAPSPTVTTSPASATQTTSPAGQTANPIMSPTKAPSGAAQQSTQPNKAPTVSAQGTQAPPPPAAPSPFYDGHQYASGSEADIDLGSTFKNTSQTLVTHWYYDVALVFVLAGLVTGAIYVGKKNKK